MLQSCNIDKWDLDNKSNIQIPNYSLSLLNYDCSESFTTNVFSIDKNVFITAIETKGGSIKVIRLTQTLQGDNWTVQDNVLWDLNGEKLIGFEKLNNRYYLAFTYNGVPLISILDSSLNLVFTYNSIEEFVDTSYNNISSFDFKRLVVDPSDGIFLIGQLSSFSKNYSCVIKFNSTLTPLFVKTYFENDTIHAILPLDNDRFIVLNNNGSEMSLISDNITGNLYKKYDLTFNETFSSANLFQLNGQLYLTGTITSGTGKTIEITLENKSAFITDVENYNVLGLTSCISTRNSLLLSGVTRKENIYFGFLSEYKEKNYMWCNEFSSFNFVRSLAITESYDVGLFYLFLVEDGGRLLLHMISTDEEGATIENPYDLNCIQ